MKLRLLPRSLAALTAATLLSQTTPGRAAEDIAPGTAATSVKVAEGTAPTMAFSPAANEVLKLVHAKIADDTIVAFIGSSTASYRLTATELIGLRSQGVSDRILTAMLARQSGGRPGTGVSAPASPAPQYATERPAAPAPGTTVYPGGPTASQPAPTYVQSVPTYVQTAPTYVQAPPVYYAPSVAPYYSYYPYSYGYGYPYGYAYGSRHGYGYGIGLPGISLSFGFGGRGHGHR